MAGFDFHLPEATTPTGPLAGCHVLVTRPALAASRTATRLAALGAAPYIVPMLIIEAPADPSAVDAAWATLGDCVAAIFVSPSAVEMSFAPFGRWPPRRMPEGVRVLAPGPGTAEALAAVGVGAVGLPEQDFDSEGMLALPELQEAFDIPVFQQRLLGIDVDREVDEIRDEDMMRVMGVIHAALQHIEPFNDQDIWLLDPFLCSGHYVVAVM